MIDLQFFTDFLFLALHLIPLAVNCASDFSLWFANRFRTESNTCQNVEREKQPVVFYTPNHAPLLLPRHLPELTTPTSLCLSASTSRSTREQTTSTFTSIWRVQTTGSTPTHTTRQGDFLPSVSQDSHLWTTNDGMKPTRYRPNGNIRFIA